MATMDVFSGDAFRTFELTDAINKVPYVPGFLGQLGIFEPAPVRTEDFAIEQKDGVLSLVQTSVRGAPVKQRSKDQRALRKFPTVRLAQGDVLRASEIQNIRAFGSESELQQVQSEVMDRMEALRRNIDLTMENHRLGAIQGIVLDADGSSTIRNWYEEFGITQATEIDFDLDNASPASGAVRKKCSQVVRQMSRAAKGAWVNGQTQIIGLCGDAFWDDLTAHSEVRQTYLNTQEAQDLRKGLAFEQFSYGGITWINYRGTDDGTSVAINTDKVKFFPVGAPGVFKHAMSPGESFDWVNTPGQPFYSLIVPDRDRNQFVEIEVYSYPLFVCTRPEMLQSGRRT